ncbi:exodeoxyribonuclease VII, large subunit [Burkholderiales bacterium JOSHI_001]|nr:exodeoxyribonuclease VII, large subunit [Burkholderiales bacterium JOSHI_001]
MLALRRFGVVMPVSESVPAGGAPRAWSVAALLLAVADALQARLGAVAVRGEISGFTRASSGHCYFSLKDADGAPALLRCAMFRRVAGLLDFTPQDGQQVELRGRITVYESRGELQCVVEGLQRLGAGTLYELFLRQKARLAAAGLFDAGRKRPIPSHPRVLGLVTSLQAAALHDVLTALARRAPQVRVVVYPSPVQGPDAPDQLVRAIVIANQRAEVDTLLLVRGGGALEDLWAFNDERVVRAVAASPIPVVCGVGHETDVTLADLAADLRAPTPTAAAELAAPARDELLAALRQRARALGLAVQRRLDRQAQRLDRLALRCGRPSARLAAQQQHLALLQQRSTQGLQQRLRGQRQHLQGLAQRLPLSSAALLRQRTQHLDRLGDRLRALDPAQVLTRGYAWVTDTAGQPITRASALQPGQQVNTVWADGQARVQVQDVQIKPVAG